MAVDQIVHLALLVDQEAEVMVMILQHLEVLVTLLPFLLHKEIQEVLQELFQVVVVVAVEAVL